MNDFVDILQCPVTHRALRWVSDQELVAVDGGPTHKFVDGVAHFLPGQTADDDPSRTVREFYQADGWSKDEKGLFTDTKAFVDTRATSFNFTRRCMTRLGKYFAKGGQYLLDAGSGPIAHDELLAYGDRFERRICVDLSAGALRVARSKLGDRGVYVQGDLTNLPVKTGSMDAVSCFHVIYQIPPEKQAAAFRELWRVLKPGGVGVIVYWWKEAPLECRIERVARLVSAKRKKAPSSEPQSAPTPQIYHHPLSLSWFESQDWPFRYRFDIYRIVSNKFMQAYVSDDWRGRMFLNGLSALQKLAPSYCGKHGLMPAIIIYKD